MILFLRCSAVPLSENIQRILDRIRDRHERPTSPQVCEVHYPDGIVPVVLTRNLIIAGRYGYGTFNRAQLEAIGIAWKDTRRKGWIDRNCGRVVTAEEYARFIELKKTDAAEFPLVTGEAEF